MAGVRGDNGDDPGTGNLRDAFNGDFERALSHLVDFFLGVVVLVYGGAAAEVVMRERHVVGVEVAPAPTGETLGNFEGCGIYQGHELYRITEVQSRVS